MKNKTKPARPLSWTPVRRGRIYCAPACGAACTYAAYLKAAKDGNALAARCGPGYTPDVFENMAWHFAAVSPCKRIRVHQSAPRRFCAYLGGGRYVACGTTPKNTIAAVVKQAIDHMGWIDALVKGLA